MRLIRSLAGSLIKGSPLNGNNGQTPTSINSRKIVQSIPEAIKELESILDFHYIIKIGYFDDLGNF